MDMYIQATLETAYIVFFSSLFSFIIGLPLGVILVMTQKNGIKENSILYGFLDVIINILRSVPFILLMFMLFPVSKLIIGKSYGTSAMIIPLTIAAAPFVARIMEQSINEINKGIIEAAKSMGSSSYQMIFKVLIPEALPSILNGLVITIINIIGYSAMAGLIGGGGLGDLATRYGLHRYQLNVLYISVIIICLMVQIVQFSGNKLVKKINKK